MGSPRCKWVRDRLPLQVDDELRGPDRRRVERHLIGCPQCRQHQTALAQALEALRTVAATTPAPPEAPSLWPALARQIRESRRPVPTPTFSSPFTFSWLRINPGPALGLGLGLLATIGVNLVVRQQVAVARATIIANARPITPPPAPHTIQLTEKAPVPVPKPRRELPAPDETTVVDSTPRLDYDLPLGRPMPDPREARDTRATY